NKESWFSESAGTYTQNFHQDNAPEAAIGVATPAGLGTTRVYGNWHGYAAGAMDSYQVVGTDQYNSPTTQMVISEGPADGNFANGVQLNTNLSANQIDGNVTVKTEGNVTHEYFVGGADSSTLSRSSYIDDKTYAAVEAESTSQINTSAASDTKLFLVSASSVPNTGYALVNNPYMTWGWWSSEAKDSSGNLHQIHLANYVAGVRSALDLSTQGTISHSGAAVGSLIQTNGAVSIASGGYMQQFDFGTRTGTWDVINFGGYNFGGTLAGKVGPNAQPDFTGIANTGNAASGTINGSFYISGTSPVGNVGGAFAATMTDGTKAAGVFGGAKVP
ncbi:MAG TPA: hypothetical protein VLL76_12400, partial [Candidatus Omnitrophota bacterium]|nr:hypothetical protein [Candidatus Omnitrophota bacterium]